MIKKALEQKKEKKNYLNFSTYIILNQDFSLYNELFSHYPFNFGRAELTLEKA